MSDLLFLIAFILFVGWLIGYFAFSLTGFFHLLLIVAAIAVLFRLIRGRKI